jgi:hypothetical protein
VDSGSRRAVGTQYTAFYKREEKVRDPRGILAPDARSARCQGASKRLSGVCPFLLH